MTVYTVTLTPDDPHLPTTAMRLDIDGEVAAVRELRLTPGDTGGLNPTRLPVLDLNQIVAAVTAAIAPNPEPASRIARTPPPDGRSGRAEESRRRANRRESTSSNVAAVATNQAGTRMSPTPDRAPLAKPAATSVAQSAARKGGAATASAGRAYRRMPEDFGEVLRQAGENAGIISDHYGVPRHTAYAWIRNARKTATAR
ncbi:hypothetical protein HDA40_002117 [Hamadaea flava]|uniref:Helix-turn-helix domain-containing protein n=1 Tax=Hamadaea flava TaxID=1742688 RepID=A0ABV8LN11_9ACTN|nr:hypothetical protein [Hamadaea flava]MCP2323610.1 hypothetical protein [Hamadaea flava]